MKVINGNITTPKGFYADGVHSGIKKEKPDMGIIYSPVPCSVAAVFTTNLVKAAPILVTKKAIEKGKLQAIIVNSGNANAVTGDEGVQNATCMQKLTAEKLGIQPVDVGVASTGIIGHQLNMEAIKRGIQLLRADGKGQAETFSDSILTTDTFRKEVCVTLDIAGVATTISGVCKGSGMIHPNMATMLGFITTDVKISSPLLQEMLTKVIETSFNQITVDGDTSTNDIVIVLASGENGAEELTKAHPDFIAFENALHVVCTTLAKKIAQDGEGATKLIEVQVNGAINEQDARLIAKKIVGSPLVKTAMYGEDPNWGRIICAIGYSGGEVVPEKVDIQIEGQYVLKNGRPASFQEEKMQENLKKNELLIVVDLHHGESSGVAWGCDLSYDYVKINALYST